MKIYQTEKDSNVVCGFNNYKNYVYINGDSIKVNPLKYKYAVNINDIHKITLHSADSFWGGAAVGSILGFICGAMIGFNINPRSDILGGIAGGLLLSLPVAGFAGIIGLVIYHDADFELGNYPSNDKKALLIKILKDNAYDKAKRLR